MPGTDHCQGNATGDSTSRMPPNSSMSIDEAVTAQCMDPSAPIDGEHAVLVTRAAGIHVALILPLVCLLTYLPGTDVSDAVVPRKRSARPEDVHGSILEGVGIAATAVPTRVLTQAPVMPNPQRVFAVAELTSLLQVPPVQFLERILVAHNYDVAPVRALQSGFYHRKPSSSQVRTKYPFRSEELPESADQSPRSMGRLQRTIWSSSVLSGVQSWNVYSSCNTRAHPWTHATGNRPYPYPDHLTHLDLRFGESVLHMACRRGANSILTFLLNQVVHTQATARHHGKSHARFVTLVLTRHSPST